MKKYIISSKPFLYLLIFANTFFIFMFSMSVIESFNNSYFILVSILLLPFILMFIIGLNRLACIVYYDDEFIYRRGLIFGFKYRVEIKNIQKVIVATIPKQDRFIILVDNKGRSYEGSSRKSFIRFTYNEKNIKFLRGFYKGKIEGL